MAMLTIPYLRYAVTIPYLRYAEPYRTYQSGRPPLVRVRLLFLSSQTQPDPVASMAAPTARIFEQMHHCDTKGFACQ